MNRSKLLAGLCGLWLAAIVLGMGMDRWHERLFLPPPDQREKQDVMIDIFGDIKTVVARYLWFKMDLFHEVLDEQGVNDARQSEVMPLLRMVSLLDPQMTDAYDQIAYDLFWGHKKADEAMSILSEGIRRNPKNPQLHFRKALIHFFLKEYDEAIEAARLIRPLTEDEFEQLNANRLIYWSAKETGNREAALDGLERLLHYRPESPLWKRERLLWEDQD